MKKYTKTIEIPVSDAVAAGLEQADIMCDEGTEYRLTYTQLVALFDLVEERAVYTWNNAPR